MAQEKDVKLILDRVETIERHFEEELARDKSQRRVLLILGVVMFVVLVIYVSWTYSIMKDLVRPKVLAEFVANKSLEVLPELSQQFETSLKATAPKVLEGLSKQLVEQLPPVLFSRLGKLLDKFTGEVTTRARKNGDFVLEKAIEQARIDVLKLGKDVTVNQIKVALSVQLGSQIDALFPKGGKSKMFSKLTAVQVELERLNVRIRQLFSKKKLSRQEMLEKRLIQAWTGVKEPEKKRSSKKVKKN